MSVIRKPMGVIANAVYVILCICTLGSVWAVKIIIQKAIIDALE